MFAGAGHGYGTSGQFCGFFQRVAILDIPIDPVLVQVFLIFHSPVGGTYHRPHACLPAGVHHQNKIRIGNGGDLMLLADGSQIHSVILRDQVPGIHKNQFLSVGGETVMDTVDHDLALGRGAVGVKIVAEAVDSHPMGREDAFVTEMVALSVNFLPACQRVAVQVAVGGVTAQISPAGGELSGFVKDVCAVFHVPDAGEGTGISQIISLALLAEPAGDHGTVGAEVIAAACVFCPAGLHDAAVREQVGFFTDFPDAGGGHALGTEIESAFFKILPAG